MPGTLDMTEVGADFKLSDILEAQRCSSSPFDAVVLTEEGKSHLYELLEAQPRYCGSQAHTLKPKSTKTKWTGTEVVVA